MIHINLIPADFQRAARWHIPTLTLRQRLGLSLIAVGAVSGMLVLWRLGLEQAQRRMGAEWDTMKDQKEHVDAIRERVAMLERQSGSFKRLRSARTPWAPRMDLLAGAVVDGVWFTHLKIEPADPRMLKRTVRKAAKEQGRAAPDARIIRLVVNGTALVPTGEETSPLGALMQALKRHPAFGRNFENVEIKSAERRKIGERDVTDFVLVFEIKEPLA